MAQQVNNFHNIQQFRMQTNKYLGCPQNDECQEHINNLQQKSEQERKNEHCILILIAVQIIGLGIFALMLHMYSSQIINKYQHQPFSLSPGNFPILNKESISILPSYINQQKKIMKSFIQYECLVIKPMFHSYDSYENVMYYQTYDEVFMPSCQDNDNYPWSINRQNLQKWNTNREVSEWALYNLKPGDRIFYYRPDAYNLLQLAIILKTTKPALLLMIVNNPHIKKCMRSISQLYQLKNIIIYSQIQMVTSLEIYNVFIVNQTLFVNNSILASTINPFSKILVSSTNPSALVSYFPGYTFEHFSLEQRVCGGAIFSDKIGKQGFYSVLQGNIERSRKKLNRQYSQNNILLAALENEYILYKIQYINRLLTKQTFLQLYERQFMCIGEEFQRKGSNFIHSIYGHKLYDVSLEQVLEWELQREPIEWVRNKHSFEERVYYEMKHSNLITIIELSIFLSENTLQVVCSKQECQKIKHQLFLKKIENVELLEQSSLKKALLSTKIITDNYFLIQNAIDNNFLSQNLILTYFTAKNNNSIHAMKKLYVHHYLKEVISSKDYCIGFQYLHYFWHSQNPNGFYEITPSTYIIYAFWGGSPDKLDIRKKFLMEEITTSTVQIKIVTTDLFLYFEIKGAPINPAYYLLTSIQKSDYVRVYLMHHYGGGYSDVKHIHFDWKPYFQRLQKDQVKVVYGYRQKSDEDIPCYEQKPVINPPTCQELTSKYYRLIGNGYYLFKKNTVVTKHWLDLTSNNLDRKYQELKKNPPQVPRQFFGHEFKLKNGSTFISKYPFRWAEIANEHLVRTQYKYFDLIDPILPFVIMRDYRIYYNLEQN